MNPKAKQTAEDNDYISSDKAKELFKESTDHIEERVNKCFSKEDYATFQTEVEKIALKVLGNDEGRTTIKKHARESAKEYSDEVGLNKKAFWIPTGIAVIAAVAAVALVIVDLSKK